MFFSRSYRVAPVLLLLLITVDVVLVFAFLIALFTLILIICSAILLHIFLLIEAAIMAISRRKLRGVILLVNGLVLMLAGLFGLTLPQDPASWPAILQCAGMLFSVLGFTFVYPDR